ncbi:MAG: nucleotidyltransferase family protein [bacterium]
MEIETLLRERRGEVLRLADLHGARDVRLFGSVARGQASGKSDIDFLVKTDPVTSPWFPAGLIEDLEGLLERKVEVVTENALHWYIRDKVLQEAVPL